MSDTRFLVHRRAFLAYNTLSPSEREALAQAITPLIDAKENRWPKAGAVRLESVEPLYMVRVDDSLRAIIRPNPGGRPEVLDLIRHEMLQRYFNGVG